MDLEKHKRKIAKHLTENLLVSSKKDQLTDHEQAWIDYVVEHIELFTGAVSEYWGRKRIYDVLANKWDRAPGDMPGEEMMARDMAADTLVGELTIWTSTDLSAEEARPYIEEGADTPEEVHEQLA